MRIKLEKSDLIPLAGVTIEEELVVALADRVGVLLSTYLGLLLGASYKSVLFPQGSSWKVVLEVCIGEGPFMEAGYHWETWGRRGDDVLLRQGRGMMKDCRRQ